MTADLVDRLRALEDRAEIIDVLHRYAEAYRRRDSTRLAACFTIDARIELGHGRVVSGHDEIVRTYFGSDSRRPSAGVFDERLQSTPLIANAQVTIVDDAAHCESLCLAIHTGRAAETGRVLMRGTRNIDDFVRTDDGWRIARRVHPSLWQFVVDGEPLMAASI